MALADFKLYTDSGLITLFTGLFQLVHQSDLSDGDQDFQLWFGSNASSTLKTTVNPDVDNIELLPVEVLPQWVTLTTHVLGDTIEPTVQNGFRYEATTAGDTGASEPVFPTGAIGSTVADGTVVWTLVSTTHEPTEIKLAATAGGLDTATSGALLSLGTSILSGTANAKEVNIRITNAVAILSNNTGKHELAIEINDVTEAA